MAKTKVGKKQTCLILDFYKLPKVLQQQIHEHPYYNRDCYLDLPSELSPKDYTKGMGAIEEYWLDQKETNNYKGALEDFIGDYHLAFEVWLIAWLTTEKLDTSDVDRILIKVD